MQVRRCEGCELELKLRKLQVLRYIKFAPQREHYELGFLSNESEARIEEEMGCSEGREAEMIRRTQC